MQRMSLVSTFVAAGIAGMLCAVAAPAKADLVPVPAGTAMKVHVVGSLSSAQASAGQSFQIAATDPVVVQGQVVVQQGAVGQGHVISVTPAGKSGKPASISVQLDWIYAVDGQQLGLSATTRTETAASKTGTSNTANVAATLIFGPVGLFAHNFVKGKDVVVGSDFIFPAYVSADRTVTVQGVGGY